MQKKFPSPQFADFLKSTTADLPKSAGRNPPICRFPQICHFRSTEICMQKFPPSLQISSNLPLQIYQHLHEEIPPRFADFLKPATADLPKSAGRNPSPVCRFPQICHCRFTKVCSQKSPPVCRFPQICHCRFTEICMKKKLPLPSLQISSNLPLQIYQSLQAEIPPFADFLKSATADLPKSVGRNPPQFADFLKSATADLLKFVCRKNSSLPSLQIFLNMPL